MSKEIAVEVQLTETEKLLQAQTTLLDELCKQIERVNRIRDRIRGVEETQYPVRPELKQPTNMVEVMKANNEYLSNLQVFLNSINTEIEQYI